MTKKERSVDELSDHEVLAKTGQGTFGPGIVGHELHERSARIIKQTGGGRFGPGIVGPSTPAPTKPAKAADADDDAEGSEVESPSAPATEPVPTTAAQKKIDADAALGIPQAWSHVTLSGAKVLAQSAQVSYTPRVKRHELIQQLVAAKVTPPAPLTPEEHAKVGA